MPISANDRERVAVGELAFQDKQWRALRLTEIERSARAIVGDLSYSTRATAYHEAGHAVAAAWFGCSFDYVTVRAKGQILGHVEGPFIGGTEREYIVMIHAGAEAQKRLGAQYFSAIGSLHDMNAVRAAWIRMVGRMPSSDQSQELQIEAAGLVALLWPRIQRVAVTLEKRLTLSQAEVYELCGEPQGYNPPAPIEKMIRTVRTDGRYTSEYASADERKRQGRGMLGSIGIRELA